MAPGSAAMALKAAAVAAVLAMLVAPSLGRCGHPPPPPPPPPPVLLPPSPAPAPGPGPTISCNDCFFQCYSPCGSNVKSNCSDLCDHIQESCDACKNKVIEDCKARGNCSGTCDCNETPFSSAMNPCTNICTRLYCEYCRSRQYQLCHLDCRDQCSAPSCIPSNPPNF